MKNSVQKVLLFVSLTLCQTSTLQAFQVSHAVTRRSSISSTSSTFPTLQMASDKEEEIAKLEDQLRKLKAEAAEEGEQPPSDPNGAVDAAAEAEEVVPEGMFLSEGWKEVEEESSEGSGGLTNILGAVGLALFLAIFSQIPIGQEDYSKYSSVTATERIDLGDLNRARQSSDL